MLGSKAEKTDLICCNIVISFLVLFKYLVEYKLSNVYTYTVLLIAMGVAFLNTINIVSRGIETDKNILFRKAAFFIVAAVIVLLSKNVNFLSSFLLAVSFPDRDEKAFMKVFFITSVAMYFITVVLGLLGITGRFPVMSEVSGRLRYALGFSHTNSVFLFYLPIALAALYFFNGKKVTLAGVLGISLVLYYFTTSRTGILSIFVLLILCLFPKEFLKKVTYTFPVVLPAITYILALNYDEAIFDKINLVLSRRPRVWNIIIMNERNTPFSLFGVRFPQDMFVDNFYVFVIYGLGLFGILAYLFIFYKGLPMIDDKYMIIACMVFLIYGMTETNAIIGSINFTWAVLIHNIIYADTKTVKLGGGYRQNR